MVPPSIKWSGAGSQHSEKNLTTDSISIPNLDKPEKLSATEITEYTEGNKK